MPRRRLDTAELMFRLMVVVSAHCKYDIPDEFKSYRLACFFSSLCIAELKRIGEFTIPGLARLTFRKKKATKAGKKVCGKVIKVKAKPARKIMKAFPTASFKGEAVKPMDPWLVSSVKG